MSNHVEVFWTPYPPYKTYAEFVEGGDAEYVQVLTQEPENLLVKMAKERNGSPYIKCPAFQEYAKNTFIVASPYTVEITFDKIAGGYATDSLGQDFIDRHIFSREHQNQQGFPFLASIFPNLLFYAKEPVVIETQDSVVFSSTASRKFKVIPGKFDISKWIRPIELAMELQEHLTVLPIKTGDPLFSVKFITEANKPVKLIRVPLTNELMRFVHGCDQVKKVRPNLKFKELYKLAENFLSLLKSK